MSEKITITQKDAIDLLSKNSYNYIHLDPYGSVSRFLDEAFCSILPDGILNITTTDLTGICGQFPHVAMNNYQAITSDKVPFYRELGARVVIAYASKVALKHKKKFQVLNTFMRFRPTHAFNREHYLVITLKVTSVSQTSEIDNSLISDLFYNSVTHNYSVKESEVAGRGEIIKLGPIWTGPIFNNSFLANILLSTKKTDFPCKEFNNLLKALLRESEQSDLLLYYKTPQIDKKGKKGKTTDKVVALLWQNGFRATKTHFDSQAIRTNASYEKLLEIIESS